MMNGFDLRDGVFLASLLRHLESDSWQEAAWFQDVAEITQAEAAHYDASGDLRLVSVPRGDGANTSQLPIPASLPVGSDAWCILPLDQGEYLAVATRSPMGEGMHAAIRVMVALRRQALAGRPEPQLPDAPWAQAGRLLSRGRFDSLGLTPLLVLACRTLGAVDVLVLSSTEENRLDVVARAGGAEATLAEAPTTTTGRTAWVDSLLDSARVRFTRGASAIERELPGLECLGQVGLTLWHPLRRRGSHVGMVLVIWDDEAELDSIRSRWLGSLADLLQLLFEHSAISRELQHTRLTVRQHESRTGEDQAFVKQLLHDLRNEVHALALLADDMHQLATQQAEVETTESLVRQVRCMSGYLGQVGRNWQDGRAWNESAGLQVADILSRALQMEPALQMVTTDDAQSVELLCPRTVANDLVAVLLQAMESIAPGHKPRLSTLLTAGWLTLAVDTPDLQLAAHPSGIVRLSPRHFGMAAAEAISMVEDLCVAHGFQFGVRLHPGHPPRLHASVRTESWGQ
ncbi:MAG: hypothetical protein VKO64_04630 [Candidatus Sericytochromatia bacterium]|nr:hypothetical protein [Candidatus Sericytochromatia bacterium]